MYEHVDEPPWDQTEKPEYVIRRMMLHVDLLIELNVHHLGSLLGVILWLNPGLAHHVNFASRIHLLRGFITNRHPYHCANSGQFCTNATLERM